jgi:hypothetical protein
MRTQIERLLCPKLTAAVTSLAQIEVLLSHWDVIDNEERRTTIARLRLARADVTSLAQIEVLLSHWDVIDNEERRTTIARLRLARAECEELLRRMIDDEEDISAAKAVEAARDAVMEINE